MFETRTWYQSGDLQSVSGNDGSVTFYKDGTLLSERNDSLLVQYWENGNRKAEMSLSTTEMFTFDESWKAWYKNGQLGIEGTYVMGEREGRWVEYDSLGNVVKEEYFENGHDLQ